MLDDLEQGVDKTDTKLSNAMSRMKRFIRQTEGKWPYSNSRMQLTQGPSRRNEIRMVYHDSDYCASGLASSRHSGLAVVVAAVYSPILSGSLYFPPKHLNLHNSLSFVYSRIRTLLAILSHIHGPIVAEEFKLQVAAWTACLGGASAVAACVSERGDVQVGFSLFLLVPASPSRRS